MSIIQKYNELIQEKYPEAQNKGIKVLKCRQEIRTSGTKLRKRWFITLQKPCGSQKEFSESSFRNTNQKGVRYIDWNNFNLCLDKLCEECKPLRFDFSEYEARERGGILQIHLLGEINPLTIRNNSTTLQPFVCNNKQCGHLFIQTPSKIKEGKDKGVRACPFCSRCPKRLCGDPNCVSICISKSLINHNNPNVMECFSPNNIIDPLITLKSSNIDLLLICPGCLVEYKRNNRTINNKSKSKLFCKNCIYDKTVRKDTKCVTCENIFIPVVRGDYSCNCCKGYKIPSIPLCGKEECLKCYDRSFKKRYEEEEIKHKWNEEKNGPMYSVSRKSGKIFSFFCVISGKEFTRTLQSNFISCTNKECCGRYTTEDYIKELVFEILGHNFYKTRSLTWLVDDITGNNLELEI